jgi:hypothetical protein
MSVQYKIRDQQGLHFFTCTICGRDSRRMEAGSLAMSVIPLWPNASTLRLSAQPTGILGTRLKRRASVRWAWYWVASR